MVTALTHLKKVFYMKDFSFPRPANPEAQRLFQVRSFQGDRPVEYIETSAIWTSSSAAAWVEGLGMEFRVSV